jgi:hypothetical protein
MEPEKKELNKLWKLFTIILVIFSLFYYLRPISAVNPAGANYTYINSSTAPIDSPRAIPAQAGNVTQLNIFGYTTTKTWQGYFGNVSGTIQLADGNDNVLYNWSAFSPQGEVYAANESSINWAGITCFNYTENGDLAETDYNINESDADGINETFSWNNGHDLFYTANIQFNDSECMSTKLFDNSGAGIDSSFEEVLLWDGGTLIFTSLLERDVFGFDNRTYDFEMMVLEDGHGTNTALTNYYFYVELQ